MPPDLPDIVCRCGHLLSLHRKKCQTALCDCPQPTSSPLVDPAALPQEPRESILREALVAARDALAAFGKQAGAVQGGYSATMTPAEMSLAQAVADIDRILKANPAHLSASPAPQEPREDQRIRVLVVRWAREHDIDCTLGQLEALAVSIMAQLSVSSSVSPIQKDEEKAERSPGVADDPPVPSSRGVIDDLFGISDVLDDNRREREMYHRLVLDIRRLRPEWLDVPLLGLPSAIAQALAALPSSVTTPEDPESRKT